MRIFNMTKLLLASAAVALAGAGAKADGPSAATRRISSNGTAPNFPQS
jgi:hypothetical protein